VGQNDVTHEGQNTIVPDRIRLSRERDTVLRALGAGREIRTRAGARPADLEKSFRSTPSTIGYVRDLSHGKLIDIGLGGQFTVNVWPEELDRYYGDGLGYAFEVFLRIRPSRHDHAGHESHEMK